MDILESKSEVSIKMSNQFAFKTWIAVILMIGIIFGKGILAYMMIGDLGIPQWDYGAVKDVPGESLYALYPPLPYSQHIQGDKGE
jgi:hypothetical protein